MVPHLCLDKKILDGLLNRKAVLETMRFDLESVPLVDAPLDILSDDWPVRQPDLMPIAGSGEIDRITESHDATELGLGNCDLHNEALMARERLSEFDDLAF